jgi:hypothetical protein
MSLDYYKQMSKKLRPITDMILHFHMQPPKKEARNSLEKKGGILFHQDKLVLKEFLSGII